MTSRPSPSTPLLISLAYRGGVYRLDEIPCALSLTFRQLEAKVAHRTCLATEPFSLEWTDDDGQTYQIVSDEALEDALDYFTPAGLHTSRSFLNPSRRDGTSSSSRSMSSVEMLLQVRSRSKISLSDFASSNGTSRASRRSGASISSHRSSNGGSKDRLDWDSVGLSHRSEEDYEESSQLSESWERIRSPLHQPIERQSSSSQWSGSSRPSLNGRERLAVLDESSEDEREGDDQGTEYAFSEEQRGSSTRPQRSGGAIHSGISCVVCGSTPIQGVRYFCVGCGDGPSFCSSCEDSGRSIRHPPHLVTHPLLKLVEPLPSLLASGPSSTSSSAPQIRDRSTIASTLFEAAKGLSIGSEASNSSRRGSSTPSARGYDVRCSFCMDPINTGPRYLCACCPLDLPTAPRDKDDSSNTGFSWDDPYEASPAQTTPSSTTISTPHEGYNLCGSCEQHSLSIHDPDHFFIKLPDLAQSGDTTITPLRLNPYMTIDQRKYGLCPMLYRQDDHAWQEVKRRMTARNDSRSDGKKKLESGLSFKDPSASAAAARSLASPTPSGSASASTGGTTNRSFLSRWISPDITIELHDLDESAGCPMAEEKTCVDVTVNRETQWCPRVVIKRPSQRPKESSGQTTPTPGQTSVIDAAAGSTLTDEANYVHSLLHVGCICDICCEPIEGGEWFRCVNCKTSFDVCSSCETRLSSAAGTTDPVRHYDGRHSFAVFKRLVDLDLLRSLVDDVQEEEGDWQVGSRGNANGSSGRAMIEFLLV